MTDSTNGWTSVLEQAASVYIPADYRHALARGTPLPEHTSGAALFADISGFTPLTEALTQTMGLRRGAEELPRYLNQIYDALVAQVDNYSGSVIGFAGDAITCWFADMAAPLQGAQPPAPVPASARATACALALQTVMQQFAAVPVPGRAPVTLSVKVAVASGPARRFVLGDPNVQLRPALAGKTLARMAAAEHLANKGEVIVDEQTVTAIGAAQVSEWRAGEAGERFAVVSALPIQVEPAPWPPLPPQSLREDQIRPWVLPPVYARLSEGLGEFLTELRPVAALFLRFGGIDYDGDEQAGAKLDAYIRWVQEVVTRYEGTLIQLTIGDKGSYLYAAFGAPIAHEDDARRAAAAGLELCAPPEELDWIGPVQIGITQGTMRTGAYGGATRRTYGVLGDQVNLAARLMQHAAPGQVLVSEQVHQAAANAFTFEVLSPIRVKGKAEPVPVAQLVGKGQTRADTPFYAGALVGREAELRQLFERLSPILAGRFAGVALVYGEAGVGKSRLVYELRQQLIRAGHSQRAWFTCPAEGILRQSLYPFKHFAAKYFDQSTDLTPEQNTARFDRVIEALRDSLQANCQLPEGLCSALIGELERTRTLLGALVDLRWEGSLYERLEPKLRFENTLAAFKTLIEAESLRQPVILHIEDAHWLDADSQELIRVLTRNMADPGSPAYPFALLITGRSSDKGMPFAVSVDADVPQLVIDLNTLSPEGTRAMAAQMLGGNMSDELAAFLADKTSGNPLFVEQLALDLHERGVIRLDGGVWTQSVDLKELEVPAGINGVLIARLDRLAAQVKAAVQTAAVLGREFEVQVLSQMLRDDEQLPTKIRQGEAEMVWSALNELRYIFRHTLLRDAAYDMQLHERLKELHGLASVAIEQIYAANLPPHYADLAYHFGKAHNADRAFHYARLAGEQAAARFANRQAMDHFQQALQCAASLDPEATAPQRQAVHAALGEVLTTTGQYDQALEHLSTAIELASASGDQDAQARACRWLARAHENRGEYPRALEWIRQGLAALAGRETAEATELYMIAGLIHTRRGDYDDALEYCQKGLGIAEKLDKASALGRAYNLLGRLTRLRGDSALAIEHFRHALDLYEQARDIQGQALTHNLLANVYLIVGQWPDAEQSYRQAVSAFEQIGDLYNLAIADNNLGEVLLKRGNLEGAVTFYQKALRLLQQIGGSLYIMGCLHNNLGAVFIRRGNVASALDHLQKSHEHFDRAHVRDFMPELHRHLAEAALLSGKLTEAEVEGQQALSLAREMSMRGEEGSSLRVLGEIAARQKHFDQAEEYLRQSSVILHQVGDEYEKARSQLVLAEVCAAQAKDADARSLIDQCLPTFERLGAGLDLADAHSLGARLPKSS